VATFKTKGGTAIRVVNKYFWDSYLFRVPAIYFLGEIMNHGTTCTTCPNCGLQFDVDVAKQAQSEVEVFADITATNEYRLVMLARHIVRSLLNQEKS
jgi:hypothetical protein